MADIDSIEVSYSRKVQLEQFEPVEHFVSIDVDLDGDDDADEVYDEYAALAEDMVERSLAERIAQKKLEDSDEDE